jgi:hypothetical protein
MMGELVSSEMQEDPDQRIPERIPTEGYFGGAAKVKNSVDAPKLDAIASA